LIAGCALAAHPATAPTNAGPGLANSAFSSIGPGLGFSHTPSPDPADQDDVDADQSTVSRLSRQIPTARLVNLTLKDAFGYIRDLTDLTMNVNWDALQKAGLTPDTPISVSVRTTTVGGILDLILASAQDGRHLVDYEIQHGALTIDSVENLDKVLVTRSYDVQAMLVAATQAAAAQNPAEPAPDQRTMLAAMGDVIRAHIAPGTWDKGGDKAPSLSIKGSALVVTANLRTQRAVVGYLGEVEDQTPKP
jgi:hypothetical protein